VENLGGTALTISVDVSDYVQVDEAASIIEKEFGPIDIWVNVAFTSVFAPFMDIEAQEYQRVTEVTYLGFVNGTRAALKRMTPRDHGTVVQVGSALGARSIPLQSAYCGAKHAVNGFTSSIRTELMHDKSNVHITVVQMPAVNTPQFSWVLSRLPNHPQPVPPIYQPEVAANAVLYAADHPKRKQYYLGMPTVLSITANKFFASILDSYLARTGYSSQQTKSKVAPNRPNNLWQPVDKAGERDFGAHGIFDDQSHTRSPQLLVSQHPRLAAALTLMASATVRLLLRKHRSV
jgi:NAD(P)-dependent dehydrogenase (short-subunit alcohol dehydrogenase family)